MAETTAKINGDSKGFVSATQDATKALESLFKTVSGVSVIEKSFSLITGALNGMLDGLGKIGLAANGLKALGETAESLSSTFLSGNAALEMTTISFKTLLGSAGAADDMIRQLTTFAAATPFNLPGLEASTQKLLAFGFKAQDIIPEMTAMGDAIAALGGTQENLDSLVYVMGQMHSEAHINAGDIMQMTNQGIPALQMLADHYKVTTGEMQQMITKGLVPGTAAVDIFTKGLEQKYGGMMAAQSATFSGMVSNLQDWATATMTTLTKPFFEPAKQALSAFLNFVQSPAGEAAVNKLAGYIQHAVDLATAAFKKLEPSIKPFLNRVLETSLNIKNELVPDIELLVPQLEKLWDLLEPIAAGFFKVTQTLSPLSILFSTLRGFLEGGLNGALAAFQQRIDRIATLVQSGLSGALKAAQLYGPTILNWVVSLGSQILQKFGEEFNKLVSLIVFYLPSITQKIGLWATAFVDWVVPMTQKLLTKITDLARGLLNWIVAQAPKFLDQLEFWAVAFIDWVIPIAGELTQKLLKLVETILLWIEKNTPLFLNKLQVWATALASWVLPAIPKIIESLFGVLNQVVLWLVSSAPRILTALLTWAEQFINWIEPMIGMVMESLQSLIVTLLNWVSVNAPVIINQLLDWAEAFLSWIDPIIPNLINALARIISSILNWVTMHAADILSVVGTWVDAFLAGINSLVPALLAALGVVITKVLSWIKDNGPNILTMLLDWGKQFINWIGPMIPKLLDALGSLLGRLFSWIQENGPQILETLVSWAVQFMDWAFELFNRIKPNLEFFIQNVLAWLVSKAPELLDKLWSWIEGSLDIIEQLFVFISPVLIGLVERIGNWIKDRAPDILDKLWGFLKLGLDLASKLITYITPVLGDIVVKIGQWVTDHAKEILDKIWGFLQLGLNLAEELFQKIEPVLEQIFTQMSQWLTLHGKEILDKLWSFVEIAVNTGVLFYDHIRPELESLTEQMGNYLYQKAASIIDELLKGIWDWAQKADWASIGENIGKFILKGLMASPLFAAINALTDNSLSKALGVDSSSAVLNKIGGHAAGTPFHAGGPTFLGEEGPEMVDISGQKFMVNQPTFSFNLPRGAAVTSNRNLPAAGGSGQAAQPLVNNYYYTVTGTFQAEEPEDLVTKLKLMQMGNPRT